MIDEPDEGKFRCWSIPKGAIERPEPEDDAQRWFICGGVDK
jgi:hypothetical protein